MVKKFFFGDDPMGKRDKKSATAGDASGRKKNVFGLNASAFIQRKMAEQQAKEENKKDDKK